jgi:hypothetical protein
VNQNPVSALSDAMFIAPSVHSAGKISRKRINEFVYYFNHQTKGMQRYDLEYKFWYFYFCFVFEVMVINLIRLQHQNRNMQAESILFAFIIAKKQDPIARIDILKSKLIKVLWQVVVFGGVRCEIECIWVRSVLY